MTKKDYTATIDENGIHFPKNPNGNEWPTIEPFNGELPEFPVSSLPDELREWAEAESYATQTPPDLAGLLALAVCAACIAKRVTVSPREGYVEPTNLFVAVLLPPANRKSAVFRDALAPLKAIETKVIHEQRPRIAQEKSERRQAEKRLAKMEKLAADKDDVDAKAEASELSVKLAEWPEPMEPLLIIDDATSEKIAIHLQQQKGRIASMSAEGGVFDLMAGLYSKSGIAQFDPYLKGHAGDDLRQSRVHRESIYVEEPALTCAYAIQPAVIDGLADNAAFRGRGLIARFLYARPRSWIGHRKISTTPVTDFQKLNYDRLVNRLYDMGVRTLEFSDDAAKYFEQWESEIEEMLAEGGDMEAVQDWGGKLAGATLRVAAIIHCLKSETGSVTPDTLRSAIEIARYLIPHAERVITTMGAVTDATNADAQYVLRWIKSHCLKRFTKRDAHRHGHRRFEKADDLDEPLKELVCRGYIRLADKQKSKSASPLFETNPAMLKTESLKSGDNGDRDRGSVTSVTGFQESENKNAPEPIGSIEI